MPMRRTSVLDPETVGQLRALAGAGNPELLDKLQASFARDTPLRLAALRAAIGADDAEALAFNLHTLKGSAANLGAIEIVAACGELEDSAAGAAPAALELLLGELERSATRAQSELARLAETG
jgi:two-component system sensor histidine kinase/response regulator